MGAVDARHPSRRAPSSVRRAGLVLLALASLLALVPRWAPASAQSGGERIVSYDVTITVERDGRLAVLESIDYDFGQSERHGIFRDLTERVSYDDTHDRKYDYDVREVQGSPGTPDEYEVGHEGALARIRIGDADKTISGRHLYTIRYEVRGALNGFDEHDELYWNAIGPGWSVPIEQASVRVLLPAAPSRVTCFAGPEGSRLACDAPRIEGNEALFGPSRLDSGDAFSVVAAIPKGVVPEPAPILDERFSLVRAFSVTPWTAGGALAVLAVVVGGLWRLLWQQGRDRRWSGSAVDIVFGAPGGQEEAVGMFEGGPYPLEYTPPEELRPGEVGTLVDEVANPLDVTATVVDLAVRGYLRIEEIPKEGWFGKADWRLVKLKDADAPLLEYERELLEGLFEDGDEVLISSLKAKFVNRLKAVQDALYQEVVRRGWFGRSPESTRLRWLFIGVAALAVAIGIVWLVAATTHLALVALPLILGALVLLGAHRSMPRRTARGTALLWRVRGFRRFIESAEEERSRFAEQAQLFYSYLPFAIVFGVTERWARAFEGLAQQPQAAAWYVSPHPFSPTSFGDSMDSFAVSSTGTLASTPGGSGGSGFGGGSSGGGGGGGGGGSW